MTVKERVGGERKQVRRKRRSSRTERACWYPSSQFCRGVFTFCFEMSISFQTSLCVCVEFLCGGKTHHKTPSPFLAKYAVLLLPSRLWKKCKRDCRRLKENEKKRKLDGMENSKSKSDAHCMHEHERRAQLEP